MLCWKLDRRLSHKVAGKQIYKKYDYVQRKNTKASIGTSKSVRFENKLSMNRQFWQAMTTLTNENARSTKYMSSDSVDFHKKSNEFSIQDFFK